MRVHLIDGTYELFRAHYGSPSRKTRLGQEVGGTRGLLWSLLSLLRRPEVTHVACAFDHVIESFRNRLWPSYKTGEGIESDLKAQFPLAEAAAHALGMVVWPMVEFEADDALASAAHSLSSHPQVEQVVICSPDKDLAQCVATNLVICWDRRRKVTLDEAGVKEKFGVSPVSIPDWIALCGDRADGIPGVPGWGAKSAATLLSRYHHLANIPADEACWTVKVRGRAQLAERLRESRRQLALYLELATLRRDVPLKETLDELRWKGARRNELQALCAEIDETGLSSRIDCWRDDS